jgi:hypothetical protein
MLQRATPGPRYTALVAVALLFHPSPDSRGLSIVSDVPELPSGTTITIDGSPGEWPASFLDATNTATPKITGKIVVSHPKLVFVPGPAPNVQRNDALYLYLVINDGSNDATDNVVFMLDVDRDHVVGDADDRGVQFNRDGSVVMVKGPLDAPVPDGVPGIGASTCPVVSSRACIKAGVGGGTTQWIVEAKLTPQDFGGLVFAGQVAGALRAKNASLVAASSWPTSPTPNDPNTWAELKLGNPVDVMLVLDLSGSMRTSVCGPTCRPKIDILKLAVGDFVNLFKEVAVSADRLGVRYFKTGVTVFPTGVGGDPVPALDNAAAVINDVTSPATVAGGMTAMGGGLQSAINQLTNTAQQRSIVLFTDGMQNVNPMVNETTLKIETDLGIPTASGVVCVSSAVVVCPTTLAMTNPKRKVSTIAIASATDRYTTLLGQIATATGGTTKVTANPDDALRQFFVETLIDALRSNSPQLIAYRHGRLAGDSATETFTTNKTVGKVILALTWAGDDSLAFRVERDGVDVTASGNMTVGPFSQIYSLAFPAQIEGNEIQPGGDWRMRITGPRGTAYQAAAIADETLLEYDLSVGTEDHVVGDSLRWTARLRFGDEPVTDATITAAILKPRQSMGTLLATKPTPSRPDSVRVEPGATAAQNKLQLLLQDHRIWQSTQPIEGVVTLKSHGDGTYSATLLNTEVVGPYTARFRIEGERADIGSYRRTETVSTVARFGRAEFRRSALRVSLVDQTPTERRFLLYLRPRDRFGNYLGPDYADRIGVALAAGTVGTDKRDLVDGGYTVPLTVPAGTDPVVTITVLDQPLFTDRLSKLEAPRFGLSLHAGPSLPLGKLNDTFDAGPGLTADATRRLNGTFTLAALLGFHHFGGSNQTGDLNVYHLSGSVEALVASGAAGFFVEAGGGAYVLDPGTTHPGAHGGLGVEFEVAPRLELGGSVRAHTIFTSGSNTSFLSIQGGGRILF